MRENHVGRDFVLDGGVQHHTRRAGIAGRIDQVALNERGAAGGAMRRQSGAAFRQDSPQNLLFVRHSIRHGGCGV